MQRKKTHSELNSNFGVVCYFSRRRVHATRRRVVPSFPRHKQLVAHDLEEREEKRLRGGGRGREDYWAASNASMCEDRIARVLFDKEATRATET